MSVANHGWRLLLFSASVFLVGCGSEGKLAPVSGRVTLKGKPLSAAYVVFEPQVGSPDQVSQSMTDSNGEYRLDALDGKSGALVGPHQVRITTIPPGEMDDERSRLPKDQVPARYQREPLTFTVPDKGTDTANFDLTDR